MSEEDSSGETALDNEQSLQDLSWAIEMSEGQFSFLLVRCNYIALREQMVQRLREICSVPIREIVLKPPVKKLYSTIREQLGDEIPSAVMVFGLESINDIDHLVTSMNSVREEFRKHFPFPLVLWIDDEISRKLTRLAPDFKSWGTLTEFAIAPDALLEALQQRADQLFSVVLDAKVEGFLPNEVIFGSSYCLELDSVLRDLDNYGQKLTPDLDACLPFVRGRAAYVNNQLDTALDYYHQSLVFWQQEARLEKSEQEKPKSKIQNPKLRAGVLLFHIGLCHYRNAELHRADNRQYWEEARVYFQQAVEVFEQSKQPDLVAKFISHLGEVLRRLKDWEKLQELAQKSQQLHETYGTPMQMAQDYGFLAEVALERKQWTEARDLAQKAIATLAEVSEEQRPNPGWYLLLLARSQRQLGQFEQAINSLQTAKAGDPSDNPQLYIESLAELRSLYFEQHEYLDAFLIKQEQRSIEQQFGFRAFIGAGRLQSQRQAKGTLNSTDSQGTVAQEIVASGREQDVNHLIERIGSTQHKLTVIHGQSGVGKSSLVNAGLVPALLLQKVSGALDILPVPLRVYTNWVMELGKVLAQELEEKGITLTSQLDCAASIIEQLKANERHDLLTVIVFDQFEEFFFVCSEPAKKKLFFDFLGQCLNIPVVKVILSLREDYLHYLLVCNRLPSLAAVNNDILSKNVLYSLGNFAPDDAKKIIQSLTARSQFNLESALIDKIVEELSRESGEVRPIELQVVGAQMQAENISTLGKYQQLGPKDQLVQRYLEEVVRDCGEENQQAAELVLYLLTDENNTRPLKTRTDLEKDLSELTTELAVTAEKLTLVLDIFVKSGLVFLLPELPANRYQIVHDYLVAFIRQQRGTDNLAELKQEREQRKLAEAELNRVLKRQLRNARIWGVGLASVAGLAVLGGVQATIGKTNAELYSLSSSSETLFTSAQQLEALIESIKAGKKLRNFWGWGVEDDNRIRVLTALQQAVYVPRERNRLQRHTDSVTSVSFSPDGKIIASGSKDKTVMLWHSNGKFIKILSGHKGTITSVMFSPNGKLLASASEDGTIKLWNLDGKELHALKASPAKVNNIRFSPDSQMLASASDDKTVQLWRSDGTLLKTLRGHKNSVTSVSFSSDGKLLASASDDATVKVWKLDGTLLKNLTGHKDSVTNVSFSPDGNIIASASRDDTIKLWDFEGTLLKTINAYGNTGVFTFSADRKILAFGLRSHRGIVVVSLYDGKVLYRSTIPMSVEATSMSFSPPDGKVLATASKDYTVRLWSLESGDFNNPDNSENSRVKKVRFSPDGKMIAAVGNDNTIKLWSRGGSLLKTIRGSSADVNFSPDSKSIVSAGVDDVVQVWRSDGTLLRTLEGHGSHITKVDFSPDGKMIASSSEDNTVKLWHTDGTLLTTLKGHSDKVTDVSFSPDGQIIASTDDKTINLWRNNGALIKTLPHRSYGGTKLRFSPNSKLIAIWGNYNTVELRRRDGTLLKTLKGTQGHKNTVNDVSFSPNEQMLASASDDNTVKLWKIDGTLLKTLEGHTSSVQRISFSPNGQTIASASSDNTIKLWKVDGTSLNTLQGHTNSISDVSFSPDGKTIVSVSDDQTVKLWKLDGQELATIRDKNTRGESRGFTSAKFSPDGKSIISVSDDQTVKFWKLDGTQLKALPGHSSSVSFSKDGKRVASASTNDVVKLWQMDGTLRHTLRGHSDLINSVSFSPDGKTIASASDDKTVRLWQLDGKSKLLETPNPQGDAVKGVSFSPDGKTIAAASADKTIHLWRRDTPLQMVVQTESW